MDTEISYKYLDESTNSIIQGSKTLNKSIYKQYADVYSSHKDDDLSNLARRLWHCGLFASGDYMCKAFLDDIVNYSKDAELNELYDFLKEKNLIFISFDLF